jgi:uncharacterized protein YceK
MSQPQLKSGAALIALAVLLSGCATAQQQRTSAPAQGSAPATYTRAAPPPAQTTQRTYGYGTDGESMLLDTVFLRPVSLVGAAVGAAAWVVSLPFSLPSGSTGEAWDALVETPLNYTFTRPLGNISACRDTDPGCRYPYPW